MEPLFTNHTLLDKTTCRHFLAMAWPKNAGPARWVLLAAGLAALVYGAVVAAGGNWAYAAAMFLSGLLALFVGGWGWLVRLGRYTQAQQRAWGGPTLQKTVRFYPDCFVQHSALGQLSFEYVAVTRVKRRGNMLLLWMGPSALLLAADGFGSEEANAAFPAFMQGKRDEQRRQKKPKK